MELADSMVGRVAQLAEAAASAGVRLMVDAEHTYFQPVKGVGCLQFLRGGRLVRRLAALKGPAGWRPTIRYDVQMH